MNPDESGGMGLGLFDFDPNSLPHPIEVETLYSWCARFHRLSSSASARRTSRILFGHPLTGLRHDFPRGLDHLGCVTHHLLGPASEVVLGRTQFGLFAPFLDEQTCSRIIEAMCSNSGTTVHKRLGLNRSGRGSEAPLKACRQCVEENRAIVPSAWWHVEHQWAPARVCLRHNQTLVTAPKHFYMPIPIDWHLPGDVRSDEWDVTTIRLSLIPRLSDVARWTEAIVAQRDIHLDTKLLRHTYLLRAKALGWVAFDGALRFHEFRSSFRNAYGELASLPGMSFLNSTASVNGGFLGQLLRAYPGARHPQKHILLMAFLFETPDQFLCMYEATRRVAMADGADGLRKQLTDTQARLRDMVGVQGRSVNATCLELGVPPSQAIRHLKKEGVEYQRRPRVLTPTMRERLDKLLLTGAERGEIALALGIRKALIKDYLADHSDVSAEWKRAHASRLLTRYREHFLKVLHEYPGVPIKHLRQIPGNGVSWLYRNDREWLASHLPCIWDKQSRL